MADGEKVVFLAFSNPKLEPESTSVSACAACRNKTFTVVHDGHDFPMMKCAACSQNIGRVGWADE